MELWAVREIWFEEWELYLTAGVCVGTIEIPNVG